MASTKSRRLRWLLLSSAFLLLLTIALASRVWLGALGGLLVVSEPPFQADLAVVLAGDYEGYRIMKGAEMVRQGFAPHVLVSGPAGHYGYYECDLAIEFAVKQGCDRDWFLPFPNEAMSTEEEAEAIVSELRRRGVRRLLLVTSNYHTRRAGNAFRSVGPELEFRVVAAADRAFSTDGWWHTRLGRKRFALEWIKTVAAWMGL